MRREEFVKSVETVVNEYINDFDRFDKNPMLRVNPELKLVEVENGYGFREDIEYSDEAVEQAAAVEGDAREDAMDNQAAQDFDYYPIRHFFRVDVNGRGIVNTEAINELADKYF